MVSLKIPMMKKYIHPRKRACNCLKRIGGQHTGLANMIRYKRSKREILLMCLAVEAAHKKVFSNYCQYIKNEELPKELQALLALKRLPAEDVESLKNISTNIKDMDFRALWKAYEIIEAIKQKRRNKNTPD